jgi:tetratricopeptide (TPR) repeat protein
MVFSLFGKKKQETIFDLLYEDMLFKQINERLEKSSSLQKLGRLDEARQVLVETERAVENNVSRNPKSHYAQFLLGYFYLKVGIADRVIVIFERLLNSGEFHLDEQQRLILRGELQRLKRERPISEKRSEGRTAPEAYAQIYSCQNCGRLINYISIPCPHCEWSPSTLDEMARSFILSNADLDVRSLLILAREVSKGRSPREVVGNLEEMVQEIMNIPKKRENMDRLYQLLRKDEQRLMRNIAMLRKCPKCGGRIIWNTSDLCEKCGAQLRWSDALRTLVCIDNLLLLLEQRVEPKNTESFCEFVCVLVLMFNNLLRKTRESNERATAVCPRSIVKDRWHPRQESGCGCRYQQPSGSDDLLCQEKYVGGF